MNLKCNFCVEDAIEQAEDICEAVYGEAEGAPCPICGNTPTIGHADDCTFDYEFFRLVRELLTEESDAFISTSRYDTPVTYLCFNHFVKAETS